MIHLFIYPIAVRCTTTILRIIEMTNYLVKTFVRIGYELESPIVIYSFHFIICVLGRKTRRKAEYQILGIFRKPIDFCNFVDKQVVVILKEMWSEQQPKEESCLLFSTSVFPQNGRTVDSYSYNSKNKGQKFHSMGSYNSSTQSKGGISGRNESFILL